MITFVLSCLIISNMHHLFLYHNKRGGEDIRNMNPLFVHSLVAWNIMTAVILLWICIYSPDPETLDWIISFTK